jgi:gluconokinase
MAASPQACSGAAGRIAVVVMGVSGCGKSTVAAGIAAALGLAYIDGDDLHSPRSVEKMRGGIALDDEDRWPWLDRVGQHLSDAQAAPAGLTLACSALRRAYRDRIRRAAPGVRFVHLEGTRELLRERMAARTDHYMPEALLDSQLQTLERPGDDEPDVITLNIESAVELLVSRAVNALRRSATEPHP